MEEKEPRNTQTAANGFTDVFLSKLKEQSFTIVLMIGVIWYQGRMMEERVAYWQKLYEEQKAYIEQTTKEDKAIMLDRIKYLQDQRDKYVEDAINELKTK
jgi:exosome complex RNA-binding protein Rrp4